MNWIVDFINMIIEKVCVSEQMKNEKWKIKKFCVG